MHRVELVAGLTAGSKVRAGHDLGPDPLDPTVLERLIEVSKVAFAVEVDETDAAETGNVLYT